MHKTFPTPGPTSLYVEVGAGQVTVHATATSRTEVRAEGRDAEKVTVEQHGDEIVVKAEQRHGFFSFGSDLAVTVTVPLDSGLVVKVGSADVTGTGRFGAVHVKSGSGAVRIEDIAGDAVIQSGSGDVEIGRASGGLRAKTGSGDVTVGHAAGSMMVASGSGRISVDSAAGDAAAKTGSGDVRIGAASHSLALTSGSGDLHVVSLTRGAVKARTASGNVRVGVPAGVPVWTDISCVTGTVRSDLEGAGRPEEGQDHIEIRATTVNGDVVLTQLR